jgi:hypothetical protein
MTTTEIKVEGQELVLAKIQKPIVVRNEDEKQLALKDRALAKEYQKKVHEAVDAFVDASHKAWKANVAQRDKLLAPGEALDESASRAVLEYDNKIRAEAKKAEVQRQRLEEEKRQKEEEALRKAAELRAAGDAKGAAKVLKAADKEILKAPPPPPPPPAPTKTAGMRMLWSATVVNLKALAQAVAEGRAPETVIAPVMPILNAMAKATKSRDLGIPGVIGEEKPSL